jgi:1-deoxy-D-xylulose-5-phosphate synthase
VDATIYDPRVVTPLDPAMIDDLARHALVVTVEDGLRIGGAGAGVRDALADQEAGNRVRVLGIPVTYVPHGDADDIHASFGLDGHGIAATVHKLLG